MVLHLGDITGLKFLHTHNTEDLIKFKYELIEPNVVH